VRIAASLAFLSLALGSCGESPAQADAKPSLVLERTIPLPGVDGRIDHVALDAAKHRLAIAALGSNALVIVDLETGTVAKRVDGLPEAQGVAFDGERFVVGCGGDGSLRFLSREGVETARLDLGADADNVRVDPSTGRVLVGYANRLGLVEKDRLVGSVALEGHPESLQVEAKGTRVFVDVPGAGHVAVVDKAKAEVVATWPTKTARANYPMALDEAHARLYVGCRSPARLLVFDTKAGTPSPLAEIEISGDVDDVFVDDAKGLVYLSCGEGFLDVVERKEKDAYARVDRIATSAGARTSLFDAATGTLYLACPKRASAAEIRVYRRGS
jgi:hypothetical protein